MRKKIAACVLTACMLLQGNIYCFAEDVMIQDKETFEDDQENVTDNIFLGDGIQEETEAAKEEVISEKEEELLVDPDTETLEGCITEDISEEWSCSGSGNIVVEGTANLGVRYTLDASGVLTFSGSGELYRVLKEYRDQVKCVHIEKGITGIGGHTFMGYSNLTEITIPDSVTSIGYGAFWGCTSLENITIPNSVTSIGDIAFHECTGLKNIQISNSVTSIGYGTFWGCTSLESITIPNSVTSIGEIAFYKCTSLKNIQIPNSVTSIEERAFNDCTNLMDIQIPDSVTSIGQDAFRNTGLTSVRIPDSITCIEERVFCNCENLADVWIPDSVTSIGHHAFQVCRSLTSVRIPDSVRSIEYGAFWGCSSLAEITIPDSVTYIGNGAFEGCSSLTSVCIPDSITKISNCVFRGCTSLTSVQIPDSVVEIYSSVFAWCTNLTDIRIPDRVTSIGTYAFDGCTGLRNIRLPDSITSIDTFAFRGCTGLVEITIPDSVTWLSYHAFDNCTGLQKITITADVLPDEEEEAFVNCPNLTIYGYKGSSVEACAKKNQIPFVDIREHVWSNWITATKATVFSAEIQKRTCSDCGAEETRTVGKTLTPTVKLNVTNVTLKVKQSTDKVAVSGLADGDQVVSWSSNNTAIVKVDAKTGKLTAQNKAGTAKVTVKLASGKTASLTVKVQKTAVKTTGITGLTPKVTLNKGKTTTLKPVREPITSLEKISYTTSNKKVVTVNSKGVISAKAAGTAKITVKAGSKKYTVTVTVPKTATKEIQNIPTTVALKKNKSYTLKPKRNPLDSDEKISYTSSNKKVAVVSPSGKITAKGKGTAVITLKSGKASVTCTVTVS